MGGPGLVTRPSSCDSLTDPELWSLILRSRLIVYWEGSTLYHAPTSELPAVPFPRLDVVAPYPCYAIAYRVSPEEVGQRISAPEDNSGHNFPT